MKRLLIIPALLLLAASSAGASGTAPAERREGFELSLTSVLQAPGDLDGGGELATDRLMLRLGRSHALAPRTRFGWQLGLERHHYHLDAPGPLLAAASLHEGYRVDLGLTLMHRLGERWSLMAAPGVSFAGEPDADVDTAAVGGGIVAASWQGEDLRLGLGLATFAGLEETSAFPVLLIDWRIDDTWRIANPLRAGPTGPAGLELSARLPDRWEAGLGSAWRNTRFRLDDDGPLREGIFAEESVPVWLRAGKGFGPLRADLYAGTALAREIALETRRGDRLARHDVDPSPFFALTLLGRF